MRYDIRNMSIWKEPPEKQRSSRIDYRNIKIEELELSVRSFNSLKRGGCHTVGDILDVMNEEGVGLRRIRNLGARSEVEIKEKLEELSQGQIPLSCEKESVPEHSLGKEPDRIRIVLRLPRVIWDKEIGEFHLSHYAEDRLRGCGISHVRDLYATHPRSEPGWYAVRELFRKIEETERIGGAHHV